MILYMINTILNILIMINSDISIWIEFYLSAIKKAQQNNLLGFYL